MQTIALFFLASVAVGGVAWVFVYPILSGERKAEQRMASVAKAEPAARATRGHQKSRRDVIENTLKEFDERHKKSKRVPLSVRIAQAGLSWSKRQFFTDFGRHRRGDVHGRRCSPAAACLSAIALGFAGAFGLPRWLLSYLKKRRESKFLDAFPDAVDIIVRGVKAGLPLLDCLKMITIEAPEPLKSEFRAIVETQAIGMPLGEACGKLYEHMPVPEANFFGIVVSIQQKVRRQSLGSARQSFARAARPQEDEGQDPGDVAGSEGLGRHHRRAADRGDDAGLHHQPELHLAAVDRAARPRDARRLRRLDVRSASW